MSDIYAEISDDDLLSISSGDLSTAGPGHDEDALLKIAKEDLINSIDTKTGAPFGIRAQVAAAQREPDRLATLRKFEGYQDAMPVEEFDPENGADRFGSGNFIYTSPETGKLTLFDEDGGGRIFGLTLADITADIGPELAETIGAIGGGIYGGAKGATGGALAGTLVAPGVGTVAGGIGGGMTGMAIGEGIGSASARQAYVKILDWFGETEDTRDMFQQSGDMAFTGGINAISGPVLSKIWKGTKWLGGKVSFKRGAMAKDAEETLEVMNRVGVTDPTVGQLTGSPFANLVEMGLNIAPTSTKIMREAAEKTIEQLRLAQQDVTERYGGARTFEETADATVTAAQRARKDYNIKVSSMYDEVGDLMPNNISSPATNVAEFVTKYIDEAKTATGADFINPALTQARKLLADADAGTLTYTRLKNFRSDLMKNLRSAESQGALTAQDQKINDLVGYITKDLYDLVETSATSMGDDTALNLYKTANEFVRINNKIGSDKVFIDKIIKKGAEDSAAALRYAFSGAKDSGARIMKLRNQFTPEEFDVLAGYQLSRMGMPGGAAAGSTAVDASQSGAEYIAEQGFQPALFLKNFNNLSKEAREAFFAGGKYDELLPALNDLTFVLERVNNAAVQQMNPSKTGKAISSLGILSMFTPGYPGLGMAGFDFGLSSLVAPFATAKLMTNPRYVKWLAEGVEIASFNPNSFGNHIRRLATIAVAEPEIRDHIEATIEGMKQQTIEPIPQHQSQSAPVEDPIENTNAFREVTGSEVANKVLPERNQLAQSIQSFDMPQSTGNMFASIDPMMAASPSVIPDERTRDIAMRQQAGIAGLV